MPEDPQQLHKAYAYKATRTAKYSITKANEQESNIYRASENARENKMFLKQWDHEKHNVRAKYLYYRMIRMNTNWYIYKCI
jgi:hypothetical protein